MMPLDPVVTMKQFGMRKTGKPEQERRTKPDHETLSGLIHLLARMCKQPSLD